jgi:propionaldehyde dehydrogenase
MVRECDVNKPSEEYIKSLVTDLVQSFIREQGIRTPGGPTQSAGEFGIFEEMEGAVNASLSAQQHLALLPLERRRAIIAAMRRAGEEHAEEFSRQAVLESGRGNEGDKIAKNLLASRKTPGVEDIETVAYSDEHGLVVVERAPYGVIGSITPVTNPTATIIHNAISMVAGGNSVVFNPHPGAKRVSIHAIQVLNRAIVQAGGPANLLTAIAEPTVHSASQMMQHPSIALLAVTGGPQVVKVAMKNGKKVIAAGPGNPPCVVDETADIAKAGRDIVAGASFDNNLVCICEKEVLVVDRVADALLHSMQQAGAFLLSPSQAQQLKDVVIESPGGPQKEGVIAKAHVGQSASALATLIGVQVPAATKLLIYEAASDDPLVFTEQLMPFIPVVRLGDVQQCIDLAVVCEHGYRHTAIMHSMDVQNLTRMGVAMNCSIFVKNGPCYAGLGQGGAGFTSMTIASPTGEGLTRARTFTRERRCTLVDYLRIV